MAEPTLKLKANVKARAVQGHPWVFVNEVEEVLPASFDGEVVECRDRNGRLIGVGLYNSASQIIWRRLSRERVALDAAYVQSAVQKAVARRAAVPNRRVIWSESDGLPGVVADQFGDVVVLQIQTLAMEKRWELIAAALIRELAVKEIIFRNDAPIRRLEGLPHETHTLSGQPWEPRWVNIDGFDYWLDLERGQKTGFYLDQREQHSVVARHAGLLAEKLGRPLRVLDGFCNQGPFALHIGHAVAQAKQPAYILGLDSGPEAILAARRNAERNEVAASFEVANVFDWLNAPERSGDQPWDLIVMDPPPFTKKKGSMEGALRGYKEINLRALQALAPGGILATYTCSHHMQDPDLRGVLAAAAADARRRVHLTEWCHQPLDHPVIATMPESEYLRGYILTAE
jgi:23S rRNA (cytosine1962-C5)-methyltransferase